MLSRLGPHAHGRQGGRPLARGAIAGLVGLVLAPAVSAEAVALPLVLLGLAAITPADGERAETGTATPAQASAR